MLAALRTSPDSNPLHAGYHSAPRMLGCENNASTDAGESVYSDKSIDMWSWIMDNASGLSAVGTFLTLLVWLFYAQLLLYSFQRQRRSRLLINQAYGNDTSSICLLSNMSHEPVYIQLLLITLSTSQGNTTCSITDIDRSRGEHSNRENISVTRQGPLTSGCSMTTGTFHDMVLQAARENSVTDINNDDLTTLGLQSIRMTAIINYGPDGDSIGFERDFLIQGEAENGDDLKIRPRTVSTIRLKNRRSRKRMARWIERMN